MEGGILLLIVIITLPYPGNTNVNYHLIVTDITEFPSDIPRDVTHIHMNTNKINGTNAEDFYNMTSLEYIDLYDNKITKFPNFTYVGGTLKFVGLGKNQINFLPIILLSYLPELEQLSLIQNSLTHVPDFAGNTKLKNAVFRMNPLNQFPVLTVFGQNLENFDLQVCEISTLPPKYVMFQHRRSAGKLTLAVTNNHVLTAIPQVKVTGIEVSEFKLTTTAPTCDGDMTWILLIRNATITGTCTNPSALSGKDISLLTWADLGIPNQPSPYKQNDGNLVSIPTDVPADTQVLDLSHNKIHTVNRDDFTSINSVTELWLWDNEIQAFPDLSLLTSLKILDLSDNLISSISSSFLDILNKLEVLNLDGNKLSYIPNVSGPGGTLRELHLSNNSFDTFPALSQLGSNLSYLYMNNNAMKSFPPNNFLFGHTSASRFLQIDLGSNQLTRIPPILNTPEYPTQLILYLYDNPLICDAHMAWLLTYPYNKYIDGNCAGPTALVSRNVAELTLMDLQQPQDQVPQIRELYYQTLPAQPYSLLLPLVQYSSTTKKHCIFRCLEVTGCVYINYKDSATAGESNCHYASPFDGITYTSKPDNGVGWSYNSITLI